ncbi:hypothetical protein [Terrabacter sp. BE26]|uniref:hypothetical protein n=1 Tax=Terrabacter sp. BE26 TaxID=2898152 RepID=UPI0035BE32A2
MNNWEDILAAVGQAAAGRSQEAREALADCWGATGEGDYAQRCVIAHYLADQQDCLTDEVTWDERALEAHQHVRDADLVPLGIMSAAAFAPSLHLNLGDGNLRLGNLEAARTHLEAARRAEHFLPCEGYGAMIRGGIDRLAHRLDAA